MAITFHLQIITPRGIEFEGRAVHVRLPEERGLVGVLANHAPYITSSPGGRVDVRMPDGQETHLQVGPGFFEAVKNQATFLVSSLIYK